MAKVEVVVAGQDIGGIGAELSGGGGITGVVTFAVTSGKVYYYTTKLWRAEQDQLSLVSTLNHYEYYEHDGEHEFEFHGLRSGNYHVCAYAYAVTINKDGENYRRSISECFDDKATLNHAGHYNASNVPTNATAIEVEAGETTGPISIVLGDEADRATFAGSIQSANGQPIKYARVELYSEVYRWGEGLSG